MHFTLRSRRIKLLRIVLIVLLFNLTSTYFLLNYNTFMISPLNNENSNSINLPNTSANEITLITPENKTYFEPMSGFYPATMGFENVNDGNFPTDWMDSSAGGNTAQIIGNLGTHKKVFELHDIDSSVAQVTKDLTDQTSGTMEFWWRTTAASNAQYFVVIDNGTDTVAFQIDLSTYSNAQDNTWYHVRVDFNCGTDTYDWYVNEVLEASGVAFMSGVTEIDRIKFSTSHPPTTYYSYFDALTLSWDPNYNIGDNLNEGLLLSYSNSTNLDWVGYSLDEQSNKTISGNTTITLPQNGLHAIQIHGNDSIGELFQSDMKYFAVDYQPISLVTPENITYVEPMSGFYPATMGFENVNDGSFPTDWMDSSTGGNTAQIIGNLGTHKKVFELHDIDSSVAQVTKDLTDQTSGTMEFWWRTTDVLNTQYFHVIDNGTDTLAFQIDLSTYSNAQDNTWYHVRVDFNCGTDTYDWYVNEVLEASGVAFMSGVTEIDRIKFGTSHPPTTYYSYFDALSLSWDPNYNIGDNLREGLLVSFENRTALDWMGYSLDNQANKTILGNTTIPIPDDGLHTIQVFGNDTLGTIHESEIRNFEIDLNPPVVSINSPYVNQFFGDAPPSFDISIAELNLNYTWYTLDNDITNMTFTGLTGTISQTEWDKVSTGIVVIKFYANDTFGRENHTEITINKDISLPIISINSPTINQYYGSTAPSFDLSITEPNLNSSWYTIDNGLTNITFTGLTGTIDQTEWDKAIDGSVSIRFFANDTIGNINFAEVLIEKDTTVPVITINSPMNGEEFYEMPPEFNLTIHELNLDSTWYTIDGGLTTNTFTEMTGFIDSTAWNGAPIGAVTIRFYARDMTGNEVYQEVVVLKRTSEVPPEIPGFNLPILFIMLGLITIITIKIKKNKIK